MSKPSWTPHAVLAPASAGGQAFAPWFVSRVNNPTRFDAWDLEKPVAPPSQDPATDPEHDIAAGHEPIAMEPPGQRYTDEDIAAIQAQALAQGVEQGRAQVEQELAQERAEQAQLCQALSDQWAAFRVDSTSWFQPLKRLSLQVGAELARTELQQSGHAIEQLVTACAQVLGGTRDHVTVYLNEADLQRLQAMDVQWSVDWQFEVDPKLSTGSVRMSTDDTDVEDFMEHRLSALAQQLLDPHLAQPEQPSVSEQSAQVAAAAAPASSSAPVEAAQAVLARQVPPPMSQRAQSDPSIVDVQARDAAPTPHADAPSGADANPDTPE
jgi:flagellar biosynthesis/type III secretory pathway protein FliH